MAETSSSASPRWIPLAAFLLGLIIPAGVLAGALMTIGAWRAQVDFSIADLKTRVGKTEENQRIYIPVLVGLSKDVSYLAERARREDDRATRDRR